MHSELSGLASPAAINGNGTHCLVRNQTAGTAPPVDQETLMALGEPYAVPLPETLRPADAPWQVYRCVQV